MRREDEKVEKYSLQQYLYDAMRVRWLKEEKDALENEFGHLKWAQRRLRTVTIDLHITLTAMRRYEDLPQNRGLR